MTFAIHCGPFALTYGVIHSVIVFSMKYSQDERVSEQRETLGKDKTLTEARVGEREVDSLLDVMEDGREYGSIVDAKPKDLEAIAELRRALREIEQERGRPCIAYIGNVVSLAMSGSEIGSPDDLPFAELVGSISAKEKQVDVLLATSGGSGQQVGRFVDTLRSRFEGRLPILAWARLAVG